MYTSRSISDLPFELFRIQCTINCFTIFVEDAVGTNLLPSTRTRSGIKVDSEQCRKQQKHHAKLQLDSDHVAGGPKAEV